MRLLFPLMACAALAACTVETADAPASKPAPEAQKPVATAKAPAKLSSKQAVANFRSVVRQVEPVAERECRARTPDQNCDSKRAGYNPVRGAQFFTRIPDPGNRFLGTHPPNAQRIETVRRVNAQL